MYLASIILLMAVLPIASIVVELVLSHGGADLAFAIGRWFVFWASGVRLLVAGIRQIAQPAFTARDIFQVEDPAAGPMVQEIGFANLSLGLLGIVTVLVSDWVPAAALASGLYYGLAGALHLRKGGRNRNENIAMVSDLAMFLVLGAYLIATIFHH